MRTIPLLPREKPRAQEVAARHWVIPSPSRGHLPAPAWDSTRQRATPGPQKLASPSKPLNHRASADSWGRGAACPRLGTRAARDPPPGPGHEGPGQVRWLLAPGESQPNSEALSSSSGPSGNQGGEDGLGAHCRQENSPGCSGEEGAAPIPSSALTGCLATPTPTPPHFLGSTSGPGAAPTTWTLSASRTPHLAAPCARRAMRVGAEPQQGCPLAKDMNQALAPSRGHYSTC